MKITKYSAAAALAVGLSVTPVAAPAAYLQDTSASSTSQVGYYATKKMKLSRVGQAAVIGGTATAGALLVGTATGASFGAILGPVGMVVGASIGAL